MRLFVCAAILIGPLCWAGPETCKATNEGKTCSYVNPATQDSAPTVTGIIETNCSTTEVKTSCEERACLEAEKEATRKAALQCERPDELRATKTAWLSSGMFPKPGRPSHLMGQCTVKTSFTCAQSE